ncbi:MAG: hypothetical protein LBT74_05610 [Acidobacteriota bacterium]|jgi:hypothetical protein|nr:hypothetical protein [Acidobacteriota bacterium]
MKLSKPVLLLVSACLLWLGAAAHAVAKDDYPYQQSYAILINNEDAGTETVVEKKDGEGRVVSTSEHVILVTDGMALNRLQFSTRTVFPKGALIPETYSNQYTGGAAGDSYDVLISKGQITRTLTRNGQTVVAKATLTPNMVLVDFNVYHQYEHLVRRFNPKKSGAQEFANYIPVIGNDVPLRVTLLGEGARQFGDKRIDVRNFRVEFVGIQTVTLSVDKNDRLVQLDSPSQQLRVIRKDLLP